MLYLSFPDAIILEVTGRDAKRYLNARLTNDLANLSAGNVCLAGALTAQGRTQGVFAIYLVEPERYLALCDGGNRTEVLAAFKKFIVADRVAVEDKSDTLTLIHAVGADSVGFLNNPKFIKFKRQRFREVGFDIAAPKSEAKGILSELSTLGLHELNSDEYTIERIKANRPAFPMELNENSLFAEIDLSETVSFRKGCYVGQEVIERLASRGKPPRVLRPTAFVGQVELKADNAVALIADQQVTGNIVSAAFDKKDNKTYAFISFKNDERLTQGASIKILAETASEGEIL